jgi:hypothetical protein
MLRYEIGVVVFEDDLGLGGLVEGVVREVEVSYGADHRGKAAAT